MWIEEEKESEKKLKRHSKDRKETQISIEKKR